MYILFDLIIVLLAVSTPVWTVLAVISFIKWQERKHKVLLAHKNQDGSLKKLVYKGNQ